MEFFGEGGINICYLMFTYQYVVSAEKGRQFSHSRNMSCRAEAVQSPCSSKDVPSPQGLEVGQAG